MSNTLTRALTHMSWANQKVYASLAELPDEALEAFIVDPEWRVGEIARHILNGATWYNYCLGISLNEKIALPHSMADIHTLASQLKSFDQLIIEYSKRSSEIEEGYISYLQDDGSTSTSLKSTILAQAIHHATEHRAQLIGALEYKGYSPIRLDDIDLWTFEYFERTTSN